MIFTHFTTFLHLYQSFIGQQICELVANVTYVSKLQHDRVVVQQRALPASILECDGRWRGSGAQSRIVY